MSTRQPGAEARRRRVAAAVPRVAAGPLALAGFFLPWGMGPGPLAATEFSGYSLVGFAGRLQALDLAPETAAGLLTVRVLVLAVAVAAAWMAVLAPLAPEHVAYRLSGWYLAAAALLIMGIGGWRAGLVVPSPGVMLLAAGAACFVAQVGWRRVVGALRESGRRSRRSKGAPIDDPALPAFYRPA